MWRVTEAGPSWFSQGTPLRVLHKCGREEINFGEEYSHIEKLEGDT